MTAAIDPGDVLAALGIVYPTDGRLPRFLAQGEYSLNYLVISLGGEVVVRLVTGSQIGLELPEQARYEARALELLAASGRTPRLLAVAPEPAGLPYPFLVESYLPGRPLDYATDLVPAAECVAAIHSLPVPDGHGLQAHSAPGPSILAESREWAAPYLSWDGATPESRTPSAAGARRSIWRRCWRRPWRCSSWRSRTR